MITLYGIPSACWDRHRGIPPGVSTGGSYTCPTTPQPALYQYIYPERYTTAADQVDAPRQLADAKLGAIWDWIDTQLDDREFGIGDGFTAADAYRWMLGRWSRYQDSPVFARPNIRSFWDRVANSPSDGQERDVANALVVVRKTTAPSGLKTSQ